jgi:hypothetical protein
MKTFYECFIVEDAATPKLFFSFHAVLAENSFSSLLRYIPELYNILNNMFVIPYV